MEAGPPVNIVVYVLSHSQEKPTGTRSSVREDLLKKFATGEGISGRMPYAILTKQFEIVGWKRMEMNKLIALRAHSALIELCADDDEPARLPTPRRR